MLAILAIFVVACSDGGTATPTTPSETPATSDGASSPGTSDEPAVSDEPTTEPTESTEPPSDEPTEEPTGSPSTEPSAEPTPSPGSAAACSGNAENKDFYVSVATAVDWTVYCPVLPSGWFVESGQYRLASGGRMEIGYKGPSGAHLILREGSFCSDADGCVPAGSEAGDAAFGDLDGTLIAGDGGSWAVVVAAGEKPSWLIEGTGLSETAFRNIAAKLAAVGD
jgi:hypothetical protein